MLGYRQNHGAQPSLAPKGVSWHARRSCTSAPTTRRLMLYARSLRRQIPNLRALSSLCCQQVTQPEAQFSTMAAVAEPETKRAKTEYSHTREVGHAAQNQQQPTAATCNRLLPALAQPGVSGDVAPAG
jgi:hypothetical protein